MPSTKKSPRSGPPPVEGPEDDILTLAEAAAYLKVTEADVLQALRENGLPGQQVGSTWRFARSALHRWLSASLDLQANKDAWRAVAGKYEGDDDLTRIRQDAYRQRHASSEDD